MLSLDNEKWKGENMLQPVMVEQDAAAVRTETYRYELHLVLGWGRLFKI